MNQEKFRVFREGINQITSPDILSTEKIEQLYYELGLVFHRGFVPLAVAFLKRQHELNALSGYSELVSHLNGKTLDSYFDFLDKLSPKTAFKFADLIEFNINQVFLINGLSIDPILNEICDAE